MIVNPSYAEGTGRRITVQGWPRQKHETLSPKKKQSKKGLNAWLK
jgi:hypothetical protein